MMQHQLALVLVSIGVAMVASGMALQVADLARAARLRRHRVIAYTSGALALGGGIWAMHFVGMLAMDIGVPVRYRADLTVMSMVPAVLASAVALVWLARSRPGPRDWLFGGLLVGVGIGLMHYTGMAALQSTAVLRFDPRWFLASLVVAVLLAVLALWVGFGLARAGVPRGRRLVLGGIIMGLAVSGMHYTGMAAARFHGVVDPGHVWALSGQANLAVAIAVLALVIVAAAAAANGVVRYRHLYAQMQVSEARLRAVVDTAVDGIITIDERGIVQAFNRSAERLFGRASAEVVGRNVKMLMPEPDRSRHDGYIANYRRTGVATIIGVGREVEGLRSDGSVFPMRLAIGEAEVSGERLFVGLITDISERRAMEQSLREREQEYRSLMANIPGVSFRCLLDADWTMLFISDAVLPLTGWPAVDFLERRRTFAQLIHPDDADHVFDEVAAAARRGEQYVVQYRVLRRDGEARWVSESASAVLDEAGQVRWIDGVIIDLTDRVRMEEALREAKDRAERAVETRSAFLANMSHEIRTPMNAILGFTHVLLDANDLPQRHRRHLHTVRQSARGLLGILNDVLDAAKLDKEALELEHAPFSLVAVCHQVVDMFAAQAEHKGLALTCELTTRRDQVLGDAMRLRQVLSNLVSNAVKFTDTGSVVLRVWDDPDQVCFRVEDTGIGIPPERLARLFEPFVQGDASMSRRYGGTGLGTTIALQLAQLMGGQLTVHSEPGVGSRFDLCLPLPACRPGAGVGLIPPVEAPSRQTPAEVSTGVPATDGQGTLTAGDHELAMAVVALWHQGATASDQVEPLWPALPQWLKARLQTSLDDFDLDRAASDLSAWCHSQAAPARNPL